MKRALVIVAALFCLGAAADPAERLPDPVQEARARALFQDIRCVVCQNESIDDSEAPLAADMRRLVRADVAQGGTDAQVRAALLRRYGEFILLTPRFSFANALLWLAPFFIVIGGGLFLFAKRRNPQSAEALSDDEEQRLRRLDDI